MESILGSFEAVRTAKWTGEGLYRVFASEHRLVGVRTGGSMAARSDVLWRQFGLLGVLIMTLVRKLGAAKRAEQVRLMEQSTMDELFHRDPKNFELYYESLQQVELKKNGWLSGGRGIARLLLASPQLEKPMTLELKSKAVLIECARLLTPAMQGRLVIDPKLVSKLQLLP
jgi:hypothetical protein